MSFVPLSELKFGHEHPGLNLNSRTTDRDAGLDSLAASILAKDGVIEPLVVVDREDGYYVVDGNRRLAAMRKLVADGLWASPHEHVPVAIRDEDDALAVETSLIANLEREPLHPVDAYEAFAVLAAEGGSAAEIAERFGLTIRQVEQRLALGRLAPEVRAAWRADAIGPAEAQAFTVIADQKIQAEVLAALTRKGRLGPFAIREEFGARRSVAELAFVGEDVYLAAGGRIADDLFEDARFALDNAILESLVRTKLEAICADLIAEGWSWAIPAEDTPEDVYRWSKIEPEPAFTADDLEAFENLDREVAAGHIAEHMAYQTRQVITIAAKQRGFTAADKARSGVVVRGDYEGGVYYQRGLIRPGDEVGGEPAPVPKAEAPAAAAAGPEEEPQSVIDRLRETQTLAWAQVVGDYHGMALELFLASWMAGPGAGSPVTFRSAGFTGLESVYEEAAAPYAADTFADALMIVQQLSHADRSALFCAAVAHSLNFTTPARYANWASEPAISALGRLYTGVGVLDVLRKIFDGHAYFLGAKKSHALTAIEECMGADVAKTWANRKKADVAAFALSVAQQKGWLPPALRLPGYSVGPTPLGDRADAARTSVKIKRAKRAAAGAA